MQNIHKNNDAYKLYLVAMHSTTNVVHITKHYALLKDCKFIFVGGGEGVRGGGGGGCQAWMVPLL